jgi:uncharacterized damage-inducible protein DinB
VYYDQRPDIHFFLKGRLSSVRVDLEEVIGHLDQSFADWAPAVGMRTVAGQLVEIAITEMQILLQLKEGRWIPDEDAKLFIGDCDSIENLSRALARIRQDTLDYMDSLSLEQLDELVPVRTQGLPAVPRHEVFRTIAHHENYHLGQLVSYVWARGDNPYDW